MSEEKKATEELAQGVRSIFDRIGEFFHLFDLSFFVSGCMLLGAVGFIYIKLQLSLGLRSHGWLTVVALLVAVYVNGLVAFAVGREINRRLFRRRVLQKTLAEAIEIHGLNVENVRSYLGDKSNRRLWRLYIRMWAEVAHRQPTSIAYRHLSRYWVMAATFDGVGFAFLVWAIAVFVSQFGIFAQPLPHLPANIASLILVAAGLFAFKRGAEYYEYQVEDLVAELATIKSPLL